MSVPRPRLVPLMVRELRGAAGRMAFFVLCLAVGVAAVVAVAGIAGGLDSGLRREGRRLLAADLMVEGPEPMPAELGTVLERLSGGEKVRRADLRELVTMVSRGGPEAGRARQAEPPGRRENLMDERSTRASARPAPDRDGRTSADASAGLDALRRRPDAPARTPTGSADGAGRAAPSGGRSGEAADPARQETPDPAAGGGPVGGPFDRDLSWLSSRWWTDRIRFTETWS